MLVKIRTLPLYTLAVLLAGSLTAAAAPDAAEKLPLHLSTVAIDVTGATTHRAGRLDIVIERWSSDSERDHLVTTLQKKGHEALLSSLQDIHPRVGYVQTPGSLGWSLRYAREEALPDGTRRIVIATDRPMRFWEVVNRPRSVDYEFSVAEIRLPKDGAGTGKLVPAARISWNAKTNTIELENYGIEPVRLGDVRETVTHMAKANEIR